MDERVLTVQQWLNATYGSKSGYQNLFPGGISESGRTGTEVEQALVAALQIELGISSPTGTFGPATVAAFTSMHARSSSGDLKTPTNKEYILQGGFWCKGYNPGGWTGIFYTGTLAAVKEFQADAGLSNHDGVVTALIMKGLLNTDPYVLAPDGDSQIRQIQQNINNKYNAYTGLMPTNGVYVTQTNKALIYALQAEEGLSISTANGSFGPTTTAKCPTLSPGDTRTNYVLILQYALYCNHYPSEAFDGVYDSGVTSAVTGFQSFMCLPATGVANMPTIKATLASCGDTSRSAGACDCATILTAAKAATLKNNGYLVVGRYLTGTAGGLSKALTRAEMQIIFNAGLRVMPIYESHGSYNEYFTSSQGSYDAYAAIAAAENLGIPSGEIIYFAVDYDAMDAQVTSHVIPYFQAIKSYAYDDSGRLLTGTDGDGACYFTDKYDTTGRIISQKDAINGTTSFNYDDTSASGQIIVTITDRNGNISKNIFNSTTKQLISTKDQNGNTKSYTYDSNGNIATETDALGNIASTTYDSLNHPLTQTARTGSQTVRNYDSNGNLLTITNSDSGKTIYTYDSGNRLTQAGTTTYAYDANDNRISSTTGGQEIQYAYENVASRLSQLLVRTDPDGSQIFYVYGLGLIGQQDSTGYSVYHFDFRGSTVALTNLSGAVTDRFTYGAYGELFTHTGTSHTPFLYNGRDGVLTEANGLYYMRARYCSPELKRLLKIHFLSSRITVVLQPDMKSLPALSLRLPILLLPLFGYFDGFKHAPNCMNYICFLTQLCTTMDFLRDLSSSNTRKIGPSWAVASPFKSLFNY